VSAGTTVAENFPFSVKYFYPQFVEGTIVLNNNNYTTCMLNYNMLRDEIEIIQNNDTLTIARKRDLKYVIAESDTFIYIPGNMKLVNGYVKPIYAPLKVFCKDRIYLKEILKRGAMGAVNRSAAIGSLSIVEDLHALTYNFIIPEDMVFRREVSYFITNPSGNLEPFKKKNIQKLFPRHKSDINRYLKANKISFDRYEDVIKFAEYLSTL
jgi:hypothetical protein